MTKEEKAELNSAQVFKSVVDKSIDKFNVLIEYPSIGKAFNKSLEGLEKALGVQEQVVGGKREGTMTVKEIMVDTLFTFLLRAKVLADDGLHPELLTNLSKPETYYSSGSKNVCLQRCKEALETLSDNSEFLVNVSKEDLEEIRKAIEAYDIAKNEPTESRQARKADGTDVIPGLFTENRAALNKIYDLAVSYYKKSDAGLVADLTLAKQIINTGIRHTGISFEILNMEGLPMAGVNITDVSKELVYVTDELGHVHIDTHKSGTFHFMIEAKGKPSKDYVAVIKRGVDNSFVIKI